MIETERLLLRPFTHADSARIEHLAGDKEVASMTGNIPHPYPAGGASDWIERTQGLIRGDLLSQSAIVAKEFDVLIGCVSLRRERRTSKEAELAYWIGTSHWGRGFATEACRALVNHVAQTWSLSIVWAGVLPDNHRSIRVLQKISMYSDGRYETARSGGKGPVRLLRYALPIAVGRPQISN